MTRGLHEGVREAHPIGMRTNKQANKQNTWSLSSLGCLEAVSRPRLGLINSNLYYFSDMSLQLSFSHTYWKSIISTHLETLWSQSNYGLAWKERRNGFAHFGSITLALGAYFKLQMERNRQFWYKKCHDHLTSGEPKIALSKIFNSIFLNLFILVSF